MAKYKELVEEYKFKYGRKPTMLEMFLEGMEFSLVQKYEQ